MARPLDGLISASPERWVVGLLEAWWGIECVDGPVDGTHPAFLHQLWNAGAHRLAWGHQDILFPPSKTTVLAGGEVEFFCENQSVWSAAYLPDAGPNPQVAAVVDGRSGHEILPLGIGLHEFLARTLVVEAVFGGCWANGRLTAVDDIDRWMVWPALTIDAGRFTMPAIYADGAALCFAFETNDAFYGARSIEELDASPFAGLVDWSEPEQGDGPAFALE
jgi:hypothetical protein